MHCGVMWITTVGLPGGRVAQPSLFIQLKGCPTLAFFARLLVDEADEENFLNKEHFGRAPSSQSYLTSALSIPTLKVPGVGHPLSRLCL